MSHHGLGYIFHHDELSGIANNIGKIQGVTVPCRELQHHGILEQWEKAHVLSLINMRVVLDRQGPLSMSFHTHKAYQDKVDHLCVPQDVRTRARFEGFQLR